MKYDSLYKQIYDLKNLILAYKKARKGKTKRIYVKEFEENLAYNLKILHDELKNKTYQPKPLKSFILRDPKTRKISKSDFRDRIIHHALILIIGPIFEKSFIYDSCANQKGKGNLFAIKRLDLFKRKVTNNLKSEAFCFKADIKHYFQEIDYNILTTLIKRKIKDKNTIQLIRIILVSEETHPRKITSHINNKGMPLGNLTSQFFANVYLHELDYFIKHNLKSKYYIRYVDDFILLHSSKLQLKNWKNQINNFLQETLKLELHPDKSKIILLSRGIDFVGFRNFYHYRLLRKRNVKNMYSKIKKYKSKEIPKEKFFEIFQGWQAYAKQSNSFKLTKSFINKIKPNPN